MTSRGGGRVERAQVGDPLELHFTILDLGGYSWQKYESFFFIRLNNRDFYPDTPYEIFVRELIAKVLEIHI